VAIADLKGRPVFERSFALHYPGKVDELLARIAGCIDQTVESGPITRESIHSIGLALPAIVDGVTGVLHWLPGYPEVAVPVSALLTDRLGLPVFLDGVADVLARAVHWFGEDGGLDDFSLVFLGLGIGLGVYRGGALQIGSYGMCSAFAHTKVTLGDGPICICGGRGCLHGYASMHGVLGQICERRGRTAPRLGEMVQAFDQLVQDAAAGEEDARAAFHMAGASLGFATANYINLAIPARIVFVVDHPAYSGLITASFNQALEDNLIPAFRGLVPTEFRMSNPQDFSRGSAALVLERLYRDAA
jgi:predicted NBD/HSP70 family sugar kinase